MSSNGSEKTQLERIRENNSLVAQNLVREYAQASGLKDWNRVRPAIKSEFAGIAPSINALQRIADEHYDPYTLELKASDDGSSFTLVLTPSNPKMTHRDAEVTFSNKQGPIVPIKELTLDSEKSVMILKSVKKIVDATGVSVKDAFETLEENVEEVGPKVA